MAAIPLLEEEVSHEKHEMTRKWGDKQERGNPSRQL